MLKYINILLDDSSVSFCNYDVLKSPKPISEGILIKGIRFAMKENLNIQFVYPRYNLSNNIENIVSNIKHVKIGKEDVLVYDSFPKEFQTDKICILRLTKNTLLSRHLPDKLPIRLNIVITDIETFSNDDFLLYKKWLEIEAKKLKNNFRNINILSDRITLEKMNNCNAGTEAITLAPNGKFYVCPAFFQNDLDSIGDLDHGLKILNPQLYTLSYAPICSHCDAFQCKRCIWLNYRSTLEVNTPSHEQCVLAHLERNAARLINPNIKEISYLDPFDII